VQVTKASVALVWLAFLFLSVISMAAIFKDATFGIVGDYQQIVPALIEQLTRASG